MSINVVNLVGRAGTDPKTRIFDTSGKVLCTFPLAVDRRSRNRDQPDWFNLKIWGRTAEIATDYVRKGKLIGIQGSLVIETWKDQNGNNRSTPVILVDRLELLGSRREEEAYANSGGYHNGEGEF